MTQSFAVLGHPVGHSLSPVMHRAWLEAEGLNGDYQAIDVAPGDLPGIVDLVKARGLNGFNVTVPHKETIMPFLTRMAPQARRIGAVNTVRVDEDGSLIGFNTDGLGFLAPLKKHGDVLARPALVIGAGGAARAVVAGLMTTDCPLVMLANRTRSKAEQLAAEVGGGRVSIVDMDDVTDAVRAAGLIVNTTTLGMTGHPPLDLDIAAASPDVLLYDIVYSPLDTAFLKAGQARGLRTLDGLHMLIHQGAEAFRIWTGITPDADLARSCLLNALRT